MFNAKALSGDRLRLVKQKGRPSWTSNMTDATPSVRAGIKSYATAQWYRYDDGGCQTFYYFSGAKQTKTKRVPAGC